MVFTLKCLPTSRTLEAEEPLQLARDRRGVPGDRLRREQLAFDVAAGGIADHAGGATDQADGAMPRALELREHHDGQQVPDVQARVGGVEARVDGDPWRRERGAHRFLVRDLMNQAARLEHVERGGHDAPISASRSAPVPW
jgi:hypothetical protein